MAPIFLKNEFFYLNLSDSVKDLIYNLDKFLLDYNYLKRLGEFSYINPYEKLKIVTEILTV